MAKDIQTEELYTLYVHTNIENKKVYIGITGKDTEERWRDGEGYKYNSKLRKRENFGEKIKNLRKTKKVNQQELADYLGIKRATISNWEINRRTPSMDDLKRVAEFFGVSLDYFGSDVKDSNMDILSRVMEYFKNEEITNTDKVTLFNNILTAYAHIVLNQDS